LGFKHDEAVGREMAGLIIPARLREAHKAGLARYLQTGEGPVLGRRLELPALRANGTEFTAELAIVRVPVEPPLFTGYLRDLSDRKRAEESLRNSEKHYRVLFENNPLPMWVFDLESLRFLSVNDAAIQHYGYSRDEFLKMTLRDIRPVEDVPALLEDVAAMPRQEGRAGVWRHRKKDESIIDVEITARDIVFQDRPSRLVLASDVTARKRAEEALQKYAADIEDLYNNAPCGYHSLDDTGRFVRINDTELSWLGYAREEVLGRNFSEFLTLSSVRSFQENFRSFKQIGSIEALELELMRKDGSTLPILISATVIKDAAGNFMMSRSTMFDNSARKQALQEIRELNDELERRVEKRTTQLLAANQELEAFTYSVSHDLRAPLRHIDAFSRMLVEQYSPELPEAAGHQISRIRESVRRMTQLIDDLLNLARINRQELNLRLTGLNSIVSPLAEDLTRENPDRRIDWQIHQLPFVECDPDLMRQVFINLLSNSVKFTRPRERAVIEVGTVENADGEVVFVRDNGVGFSMKYAVKLFGVFQRLHRQEDFEGTGVGLAIALRVINKHGGRIWAEAELNKGAAFYFSIPKVTPLTEPPARN